MCGEARITLESMVVEKTPDEQETTQVLKVESISKDLRKTWEKPWSLCTEGTEETSGSSWVQLTACRGN